MTQPNQLGGNAPRIGSVVTGNVEFVGNVFFDGAETQVNGGQIQNIPTIIEIPAVGNGLRDPSAGVSVATVVNNIPTMPLATAQITKIDFANLVVPPQWNHFNMGARFLHDDATPGTTMHNIAYAWTPDGQVAPAVTAPGAAQGIVWDATAFRTNVLYVNLDIQNEPNVPLTIQVSRTNDGVVTGIGLIAVRLQWVD